MDPDEALKMARAAIERLRLQVDKEYRYEYVATLLDAFESLDEWLSKGGFLPDAWRRKVGA